MNENPSNSGTHDIVLEEVLPHAPDVIWRALTTGALIDRWLMKSTGFEAVKGARFQLHTAPAGAWDGVIQCEVLEVQPNELLSYSWKGGDNANEQYGSRLDTVVTWTLAKVSAGTRLRLVHAGFVPARNDFTFRNLNQGWASCFRRIDAISSE